MEILDFDKDKNFDNIESTPMQDFDASHKLASNKSTDVFNALNLYSEQLGLLYEKEGYNPFDKDFVLDSEFTKDVLTNKNKSTEIFPENFLEANNKSISKNFEIAIENNTALVESLQKKIKELSSPKEQKQLKQIIVTLKNRGELLKISKEKLKQKNADAVKMYTEIFGLDSELSELLQDSYTKKINFVILMQKLMDLSKSRAAIFHKSPKIQVSEQAKTAEQNIEQTQTAEQHIEHRKEQSQQSNHQKPLSQNKNQDEPQLEQ